MEHGFLPGCFCEYQALRLDIFSRRNQRTSLSRAGQGFAMHRRLAALLESTPGTQTGRSSVSPAQRSRCRSAAGPASWWCRCSCHVGALTGGFDPRTARVIDGAARAASAQATVG